MTAEPDPRISFETSGADLDAAVHMYEDAYASVGFTATRTERPFAYRFRVVGDDVMSFRSTRFDARMQGELDVRDEYVVMWITDGGGRVDIGRQEVAFTPATPMMFPTGRPFAFDLQDVRQSLVQFDRTALERVAAEVHGAQPGGRNPQDGSPDCGRGGGSCHDARDDSRARPPHELRDVGR